MKLAICSAIRIVLPAFGLFAMAAMAQPGLDNLAHLPSGRTKADNALWVENDPSLRFIATNRVVVASITGPAQITMIHFADPETHELNRDLLLRIYWDGEPTPSVEVPMVDFFCDPAGLHASVNTILVNKRRGFNTYFPMPFRKSAKIELAYDGPVEPGAKLCKMMPCYSYVMYRSEKKIPADTGYFCASWRQEALLLGTRDYLALEAQGKGKFVGWNVTVRQPGRRGYPVDENEKFYIDGEPTASVEFQGLEDSFGFSWGFPESESSFPRTGWFQFLNGAAAYRFFIEDAINFDKSLKVEIGFGEHESPFFRREFSKPGTTLQLSSTVYWYQSGARAPLPVMPPAVERAQPAPDQPLWPEHEKLPSIGELQGRGVKLRLNCGRPGKEIIYAAAGYKATATSGTPWDGWPPPIYYCRAADEEVAIDLTVPQNSAGLVRVFVIDPDEYHGGRQERLSIAGDDLGAVANFEEGKWIEHRVTRDQTAEGRVHIRAANERKGANAVISIVEWVETPVVN